MKLYSVYSVLALCTIIHDRLYCHASVKGRDHNEDAEEKLIISARTDVVDKSLKALIIGDSMTAGFEGDYTWRYRLWEWATAQGLVVNFVGPFQGTSPQKSPMSAKPQPPPLDGQPDPNPPFLLDGSYARDVAKGWTSSHGAIWGRRAGQAKNDVNEWVTESQPDYLLVMLGINDMGGLHDNPQGTLDHIQELVHQARLAHPTIKIVLGNVVKRDVLTQNGTYNTDEYNRLLQSAVPQWNTSQSPITIADIATTYPCVSADCPGGYDGLHPNALGDFQIAQAFSRALVSPFGLDNKGIVIENVPQRPADTPTNIRATTFLLGIKVEWDQVLGAMSYVVETTDKSTGNVSTTEVQPAAWYYDVDPDGQEWSFRVRAKVPGGNMSDWSSRTAGLVAHPRKVPPPNNFKARTTSSSVELWWDAPETDLTIDRYQIVIQDLNISGAYPASRGSDETIYDIRDLIPGHHYAMRVATWVDGGSSTFTDFRTVIAGAVVPPELPVNLSVIAESIHWVQIAWDSVNEEVNPATGYRVQTRQTRKDSAVASRTSEEIDASQTRFQATNLDLDTYSYTFCVSAINGALESVPVCEQAVWREASGTGGKSAASNTVSKPISPVPTSTSSGTSIFDRNHVLGGVAITSAITTLASLLIQLVSI